jgi:para-aminobenzoate synthetase component 1
MGKRATFPVNTEWIPKLLAWANVHFPYLAHFSPNSVTYPYEGFEQVFFAGEKSFALEQLKELPEDSEKIGILAYDLKNHFERLQSNNPHLVDSPESVFFLPSLKITFTSNQVEIFHSSPEAIFNQINSVEAHSEPMGQVEITPLTSREEYLNKAHEIKNHIVEGDIYEMNYCIAFSATFNSLDPVTVYLDLMKKSPMPFSVFFKAKDQYLISASPERFLKKSGSSIIAQPIKGTTKRGTSPEEDQQLRHELLHSEKERAENLMIVDLMRNDLARISETGTVKVEEMFGIYPFKRVSQMISTVSATLQPSISFEEIIAKTFPMGSMTGAPKIRCMELIDQHENFRRGWFSGAAGYISPCGDFDFNVVIRSIIIDQSAGKLFFAVGSAITYDADPLLEYEECLLKAKPIFEVLSNSNL